MTEKYLLLGRRPTIPCNLCLQPLSQEKRTVRIVWNPLAWRVMNGASMQAYNERLFYVTMLRLTTACCVDSVTE